MDRKVVSAMRTMEQRMGDDLQMDELARSEGLSPRHFHRLFMHHADETPAAFLRRIRMDEAALRLRWADETTEDIAHALGFRSRPAFIRAFEKQFGVPPAQYRKDYRASVCASGKVDNANVAVREVEAFTLVARRYVGDIYSMRDFWADFTNRLPLNLRRKEQGLYVGRLHDDPRYTDPDKGRYDCGVALSSRHGVDDEELHDAGLAVVETDPGRYASIRHHGHRDHIPNTYDRLTKGWLLPNAHVPAALPALEIHTLPRHLQDAECVDFTILLPVE